LSFVSQLHTLFCLNFVLWKAFNFVILQAFNFVTLGEMQYPWGGELLPSKHGPDPCYSCGTGFRSQSAVLFRKLGILVGSSLEGKQKAE
jgi:hypothetical protein